MHLSASDFWRVRASGPPNLCPHASYLLPASCPSGDSVSSTSSDTGLLRGSIPVVSDVSSRTLRLGRYVSDVSSRTLRLGRYVSDVTSRTLRLGRYVSVSSRQTCRLSITTRSRSRRPPSALMLMGCNDAKAAPRTSQHPSCAHPSAHNNQGHSGALKGTQWHAHRSAVKSLRKSL